MATQRCTWRLVLVAMLAACGPGEPPAPAVVVYAAASLADAVTDAAAQAGRVTGTRIRTSVAASSTLAAQITRGAPADVFLSADPEWADRLVALGLLDAASAARPITNRLVVVAPRDAPTVAIDLARPATIVAALGPRGRLAVGDPDHVPAGRHARAVLERTGLWPTLAPRLARAQDVRAALALVARGETPLGIVYATDAAVSDAVRVVATVPASLHPPVVYVFAVVAGHDTPPVRRVFAWITGPTGLAVFERHGFARS